MARKFGLINEHRLQRKERYIFLKSEIDYFIFRCMQSEYHTDVFIKSCLEYAKCLQEILQSLKKYEVSINPKNKRDLEILENIESTFRALPALFQNLNTSIIASRYNKIRSTTSAVKCRFPLSEVHPDYTLTIRSMEGLNAVYHQRLKPFYSNFHTVPLLVVISPSDKYAFDRVPLFHIEMYSLNEDFNEIRRKKLIRYFLNLSWIVLPRWFPIQVRNAPILAHEGFHRILGLAFLFNEDLENYGNPKKLLNKDPDNEFIINFYGHKIAELGHQLKQLAKKLTVFLYSQREKGIATTTKDFKQKRRASVKLNCYEIISNSALSYAEEFIADIGATLLAGPAFVFALLSDPGISTTEILDTLDPLKEMRHPPLIVRGELLCFVLRYLKFRKMAEECDKLLNELKYNSDLKMEEKSVLEEFEMWFMQNKSDIIKTIDLIRHTMPTCIGNKLLLNHPKMKEEKWIRKIEDLRKQIRRGNLLSIKISPEEILNAIWIKKSKHPKLAELHIAWRILLVTLTQNYLREEI